MASISTQDRVHLEQMSWTWKNSLCALFSKRPWQWFFKYAKLCRKKLNLGFSSNRNALKRIQVNSRDAFKTQFWSFWGNKKLPLRFWLGSEDASELIHLDNTLMFKCATPPVEIKICLSSVNIFFVKDFSYQMKHSHVTGDAWGVHGYCF